MRKWLAAHAEQVSEPAWRADLWGRRILFWTAYAPYILSSARPGLSLGGAQRARARRASSRARRGQGAAGPAADHRLGRRDRRRSGRPGRAGAAQHRRGRARPRARRLAARRWRPRQPLAGRAARSGRDCSASCAPSIIAGAARRAGMADRGARRRRCRPCSRVTLGDEALSSWQGGNMASRRRVAAAIEGAGHRARGRSARRAAGAISGCRRSTSVLVFDAAPPPPPRSLRRRLRLDPGLRVQRRRRTG